MHGARAIPAVVLAVIVTLGLQVFDVRPPTALGQAVPPTAPGAAPAPGGRAGAWGPSLGQPIVRPAVHHDTSPPLRAMPVLPPRPGPARTHPVRVLPERAARQLSLPQPGRDPVLQVRAPRTSMPAPLLSFAGNSSADNTTLLGITPIPPDTNGDVGPNHYVQMINLVFSVYDKAGNRLYGPAANNTLWTGFGGPCETSNQGDPIVLYDPLADRWVLSQFGFGEDMTGTPVPPFFECIAVSATSDPTGSYHRYAFQFTKFPDYPKLGVWPDGYYMTINQFNGSDPDTGQPNAFGTNYQGVGAVAFDRSQMLSGSTASMIYFDLCPTNTGCAAHFGMLPSDLDGPAPPAGSPNYFAELTADANGNTTNQLSIFGFHADFTTPANSTFTGPTVINTAPFTSILCGANRQACIPQPGTTQQVEALNDRLMHRLQYRNFGAHESLVTNHTVNVGGGQAGIRWYELRKSGANPFSMYQQGTYAGDAAPNDFNHRWMGSAALDKSGNLAIGYSVSALSGTFPSIRYVGRLANDPLGVLSQGETSLIAGNGSQTDAAGRWGDYSMLAVDPTDDCTFWYTQEYYDATSARGFKTRIGSFKFPSCGQSPPPAVTPSPTATSQPGAAILYDQYNSDHDNLITNSQNFEPAFDSFDDQTADDFVVPAGHTWNVSQVEVAGGYFNGAGPASSVNVFIYANNPATNLPGTLVFSQLNILYAAGPARGDFVIPLSPAATLAPGTYWLSVQANMSFNPNGQWGWTDRLVGANNPAAWIQPGNGFATGCTNWGRRGTCVFDPTAPDKVFRLRGTDTLGSPTPTATATSTPSPTSTPTITPTPYPRPNVGVQVAPGGGVLQTTIAARDAGCPQGNNQLFSIQFTQLDNASVEGPGFGPIVSPQPVALPSHPPSVVLTIRRLNAGQATTVRMVVTDGCGTWPTFVGGGPSAF